MAALPAAAQDATWELNPTVAGPTAATFEGGSCDVTCSYAGKSVVRHA